MARTVAHAESESEFESEKAEHESGWTYLSEEFIKDLERAIRQGSSLEERFIERVGGNEEAARKLSWLEDAVP